MLAKYMVNYEWIFLTFGVVRWEECGGEILMGKTGMSILSLVRAISCCRDDFIFDDYQGVDMGLIWESL